MLAKNHLAPSTALITLASEKAPKLGLCTRVLFATAASVLITPVGAQVPAPTATGVPLASLKSVTVPDPPNLSDFVKDRGAAIALGKALFWDTSVGSDGVACGTCHFNAGADSRSRNQVDPGLRAIPVDNSFTAPFKADYQLKAADFPFHRLADPNDHRSGVLFETNDIASSQGVTRQTFTELNPGNAKDKGSDTGFKPDPIFNDGNHSVRAVEPRNTPTVINAVFNFRNFWDGRARDEFNCVTPIGDLDPTARVVYAKDPNTLQAVPCRLEHSSLASQAVGPALSDLEMSYGGRSFPLVGRKMLSFDHALREQRVDPTDSVLGKYMQNGKGLAPNYQTMIQSAFQPNWYNANLIITVTGTSADGTPALRFDKPPTDNSGKGGGSLTSDKMGPNQYTQMEYNFSLFWGLAIQLYESTLRADDSHFDQYFEGKYTLTDSETLGLDVFVNKGKCLACHGGAETTNASVQNVKNEKLERMLMGNNQVAVYDNGFYNTGVRSCAGQNGAPPCDDIGIGATIGPLNLPLSLSRYFQLSQYCGWGTNAGGQTGCLNAPLIAPRPLEGLPDQLLQQNERVAVDGAFKTPGLRNVELTAPYFHNGGDLSLEQVVDFYNRAGNFPEANEYNLDPNITSLGLTSDEKAGLVALMKAMTDERVRYRKAPFDHPEISIPNFGTLPAVGAAGTAPLPTFASTLP